MRITIEINEAIARDFEKDKFEDFFERVIADIDDKIVNHNTSVCGKYELEIAEELERAFKEAEVEYEYVDPEPKEIQIGKHLKEYVINYNEEKEN